MQKRRQWTADLKYEANPFAPKDCDQARYFKEFSSYLKLVLVLRGQACGFATRAPRARTCRLAASTSNALVLKTLRDRWNLRTGHAFHTVHVAELAGITGLKRKRGEAVLLAESHALKEKLVVELAIADGRQVPVRIEL